MATTYLNRGMYGVVEAAHLVEVKPSRILTWARATSQRPALVVPSLEGGLYSFLDLIALKVVAELVRRNLRLRTIASGIADLKARFQSAHPLAHREGVQLATLGDAFFASAGDEWIDVSKGGQGAFQGTILPELKGLQFGDDDLASLWRPVERVWVNPRIQAGASCIDETRVPTAVVYDIVEHGDHPVDVARDYDLALEDVIAAYQYEKKLSQVA